VGSLELDILHDELLDSGRIGWRLDGGVVMKAEIEAKDGLAVGMRLTMVASQ
jgi:hypothetical protein